MALKFRGTKEIKRLCKAHRVTIHARTDARGQSGGKTPTWASTGTAATCCVQPASSNDQVTAMQRGYEVSHVLYFATDPGLKDEDGVLWGSKWLVIRGAAVDAVGQATLYKFFAEESQRRQQDSP